MLLSFHISFIWGILRHANTSSASKIFVSFQILIFLIFLISVSNLIALTRTPETILNNNGNNRHPYFISNLRGSKYDDCCFGILFTALRKCPISIFKTYFIRNVCLQCCDVFFHFQFSFVGCFVMLTGTEYFKPLGFFSCCVLSKMPLPS